MEQHQLIGGMLMLMAIMDLGVGGFIASRIEDRQKKMVISLGMVSGAVIMGALGAAFFLKLIPLG